MAGKQQPELNERPASLLVPTSVSRAACLRSFGTLTRFLLGSRYMHFPPYLLQTFIETQITWVQRLYIFLFNKYQHVCLIE